MTVFNRKINEGHSMRTLFILYLSLICAFPKLSDFDSKRVEYTYIRATKCVDININGTDLDFPNESIQPLFNRSNIDTEALISNFNRQFYKTHWNIHKFSWNLMKKRFFIDFEWNLLLHCQSVDTNHWFDADIFITHLICELCDFEWDSRLDTKLMPLIPKSFFIQWWTNIKKTFFIFKSQSSLCIQNKLYQTVSKEVAIVHRNTHLYMHFHIFNKKNQIGGKIKYSVLSLLVSVVVVNGTIIWILATWIVKMSICNWKKKKRHRFEPNIHIIFVFHKLFTRKIYWIFCSWNRSEIECGNFELKW